MTYLIVAVVLQAALGAAIVSAVGGTNAAMIVWIGGTLEYLGAVVLAWLGHDAAGTLAKFGGVFWGVVWAGLLFFSGLRFLPSWFYAAVAGVMAAAVAAYLGGGRVQASATAD